MFNRMKRKKKKEEPDLNQDCVGELSLSSDQLSLGL